VPASWASVTRVRRNVCDDAHVIGLHESHNHRMRLVTNDTSRGCVVSKGFGNTYAASGNLA
jgi:hypothetical protein